MRHGYTILDHPADIGIEASGATLAEAFANAASGMMAIIVDHASVKAVQERFVRVSASDAEQLLVRWLSEVLYLYDGEKFIGTRFEVRAMDSTTLEAVVHGEPLDLSRHLTRLDVKAVTYHQLLVEENATGARIRVYLDI